MKQKKTPSEHSGKPYRAFGAPARRPSAKRPPSDPRAQNVPPRREQETDSGLIEGRNAVLEAIRANRTVNKLYISGEDHTAKRIRTLAREAGIVVVDCERRQLDELSPTGAHQGVIAMAASHDYVELDDIIFSEDSPERPGLIVMCDGIADPRNLGAIIRSAECAGARGVVIPKRGNVALTAIVAKTSAGALEHMPVARVPNVSMALDTLKKNGYWIFGADHTAERSLYDADFTPPSVIVIGSEGEGLGRLVREKCDFLVNIPMLGHIGSLNAASAASVLLFEAVRQRLRT